MPTDTARPTVRWLVTVREKHSREWRLTAFELTYERACERQEALRGAYGAHFTYEIRLQRVL